MGAIPVWVYRLPWDLLSAASKEHKIDLELLGAICSVESGGRSSATRYEPNWKYFSNPRIHAENLGITEQTERVHQATSWGMLQVMGAVTRELGYLGPIPGLWEPKIGLYWGARKLREVCLKYPEESDAIAAYNAGSPRKTAGGLYENQTYVDKVHSRLIELRKLA